jgi:hypothetical protein
VNPQQEQAMRTLACIVVLHLIPLSSGCTKTVINRVANFDTNRDTVTAIVPETGVYRVKYVSTASNRTRTVRDSSRILAEGDRVGFRRTDDGRIVALARDEEFELHDLPPDASQCCWYHRGRKLTTLARNVNGALDAAGTVAAGAAYAAGAMFAAEAYANGLSDDDDCDPPPKKHRHSGRHH